MVNRLIEKINRLMDDPLVFKSSKQNNLNGFENVSIGEIRAIHNTHIWENYYIVFVLNIQMNINNSDAKLVFDYMCEKTKVKQDFEEYLNS